MRIGLVRQDLNRVYLADVENASQRCFSAEPIGQSRYFEHPTDTQFLSVLNSYAKLSLYGSDNAAAVDTTGGKNVFLVKTHASASFTTVTVTSNAALAKSDLVNDLNAGFRTAGLKLVARLSGNHVVVDTVSPLTGPTAKIIVDVDGNSKLNPVVGFTSGTLSGLTVSALKAAVYPTATTFDVSTATLVALSTFTYMTTSDKAALVSAVADLVAPKLVETGPALLSYVYGNLSKLRSASFQPGGSRIGLATGKAVYISEDDGTTAFTV